MKFQSVGCLFSAALLGFVAACSTTPSDRLGAAHIAAPAVPSTLSRIVLTQRFNYAEAAPVPVSAAADSARARQHEIAALDPRSSPVFAHAGEAAAVHDVRRIIDAAPAGWTRTPDATLRHELSGLNCPQSIELTDENRRFLLVQTINFDERGQEAGCLFRTDDGGILALFASYWPEISLADNFESSLKAIDEQFDLYGDLPLSVAMIDGGEGDPLYEGLEATAAGAFDIGVINGRPYKTSVWLAKTHGWHVKARASYTQADITAELVSAVTFAFSHLNVRARNMNAPMSAGEI